MCLLKRVRSFSSIPPDDSSSRTGLSPLQDDELHVNTEPVQCWGVCRRSNWPERDGGLYGIHLSRSDAEEVVMDASECEDNETESSRSFNDTAVVKDVVKTHERPLVGTSPMLKYR